MYLRDIPKVTIKRKPKKVKPVRVKKPSFAELNPHLYDKAEIKRLFDLVVSIYGKRCMKCGIAERIVLEHIKSRIHGGSNDLSNLQLLCSICNIEKGHKQIDYRP